MQALWKLSIKGWKVMPTTRKPGNSHKGLLKSLKGSGPHQQTLHGLLMSTRHTWLRTIMRGEKKTGKRLHTHFVLHNLVLETYAKVGGRVYGEHVVGKI